MKTTVNYRRFLIVYGSFLIAYYIFLIYLTSKNMKDDFPICQVDHRWKTEVKDYAYLYATRFEAARRVAVAGVLMSE